MIKGPFISIGTKGTSLPTELDSLQTPLTIGVNTLRWAGRGHDPIGLTAHAWVSKNGEQFELYPLSAAILQKRVVHVKPARWKANGRVFEGEAFFPAKWKPEHPQPSYVAVRANGWPHGSVERDPVRDGRNKDKIGKFIFDNNSLKNPALHSDVSPRKKTERKRWTKEELLIALNIYRKLNFGQLDEDNPVVKDLATKMGRTRGSVAMKLCNFASLDPAVTSSGRKGLEGASDLDRELWKEFLQTPASVIPVSEELFHKLFSANEADEVEVIKDKGVKVARKTIPKLPIGETAVTAEVQVRRGQDYFRQVILNAFNNRCCVSGIPIRSMLVASHILPWSDHPAERLNPANGLCLSRIHDIAFDRKLITFDDDYRLVLSNELRGACSYAVLKESFIAFEGKPINLPEEAVPPNKGFLAQHRIGFST